MAKRILMAALETGDLPAAVAALDHGGHPEAHRRIGIGKLTAHQKRERSCRRDSFAGSLGAAFQYQVMYGLESKT